MNSLTLILPCECRLSVFPGSIATVYKPCSGHAKQLDAGDAELDLCAVFELRHGGGPRPGELVSGWFRPPDRAAAK